MQESPCREPLEEVQGGGGADSRERADAVRLWRTNGDELRGWTIRLADTGAMGLEDARLLDAIDRCAEDEGEKVVLSIGERK